MDTNTKTPVDIIQELLAIHSTRKEVSEKLLPLLEDSDLKTSLENSKNQSDEFIASLMEELSHSGDAVQGETDRENDYQVTWKKAFQQIDGMNADLAASTFKALEQSLKAFYDSLDNQTELPESLRQSLDEQRNALN